MPYGWSILNDATMRYEPASAETPGAVYGYWVSEAEQREWERKMQRIREDEAQKALDEKVTDL